MSNDEIDRAALLDNMTVNTISTAERLAAKAFTRGTEYNQWLFDPTRSPDLHAIAARAHREMRELMVRKGTECDDESVLVHFVGSDEIFAYKRGRSAERFAAGLRMHNATQPYCDEYVCNIRATYASTTSAQPARALAVRVAARCSCRCYSVESC